MIKNPYMRIFYFILLMQLFVKSFAMNYSVNTDFFSRFNDEKFTCYIYQALVNNHDLRKADYKVEQYRYEITNAISKELPQLSVAGNYLGTHFPRGDRNFFIRENSFILPFRVNFEPDLLLKNKDKIESVKKIYKANVANQKRTYISLLSDVANAYLNILLFDYLIEKQNQILANKLNNANSNAFKFRYGVIDLIGLNNIWEDYNTQKIILDNLIKNQKTALFNFASLIGESAMNWQEIERGKLEDFEYQETIPAIINSDLIYQRPDVIEIENKLKSAKIDITVAKKDFFPSFNINGGLIFDTAGGGNFFSWGSSFAYLLMGATQDIFSGGAKLANLRIKKARFKELLEEYQQTDLNAIKEVVNALNLIEKDTQAQESAKKQLELQKVNFNKSNKKLKQGTISKIDYAEEKNNLHLKEQLFMTSKAARLSDYFTLYKALGGEL